MTKDEAIDIAAYRRGAEAHLNNRTVGAWWFSMQTEDFIAILDRLEKAEAAAPVLAAVGVEKPQQGDPAPTDAGIPISDERGDLVDDALAKVSELGTVGAMKWLLGQARGQQQAGVADGCRHRIADARNPHVESGYVCIDCGALFAAADHSHKARSSVPWEA